MKSLTARHAILPLVGLTALTVYILACTSFSPDDRKVLYPAFDEHGALGISIYDRDHKRSELVFVPMPCVEGTNVGQPLVRAQWLGDGRRILLSWADDKRLNLGVMTPGGKAPFRVFVVPGLDEPPMWLTMPVAVVRDQAFFVGASNQLTRLDLNTGETVPKPLGVSAPELRLWPGPDGQSVYYLQKPQAGELANVFGRLNPETLALTPLLRFTNRFDETSFFVCNAEGTRLAFLESRKLMLVENGNTSCVASLEDKDSETVLSSGVFSRGGDTLLAGYQEVHKAQTNSSLGVIEFALSNGAARKTPILEGMPEKDDTLVNYFQVGFSHDGKTAAVATTYLTCYPELGKAANCGLFFVDLNKAKRPVTKVAIPVPPKGPVALIN